MGNVQSWKEEAWESFLSKFWDKRPKGINIVEYTTEDLEPFLNKYAKSGQGEIRTFHYEHEKISAVKKRNVAKIPISRKVWALVERPQHIIFQEPVEGGIFVPSKLLTQGMVEGIKATLDSSSNPGETTLLAIANHTGIISDFYHLDSEGVLFTGGRQSAGVHIVIGMSQIDMSKAQIEIDGGFEWADSVVIVEMKSSLSQPDFDTNQALLPMLKWKKLLNNKVVYSLVLLAETKKDRIEYWAYDLKQDTESLPFGMKIVFSKKYKIEVK